MKAKSDNQKEIAAEKKRMEAPTESRGISKQKWIDERKKKIGKLLDANGLDMTKAYMLDTQEAAELKYKKWEKDPAPYGWDGMFIHNFIDLFLFHHIGYTLKLCMSALGSHKHTFNFPLLTCMNLGRNNHL